MLLPRLEVDTYLTNLLGPDYQVEDGSFETSEMNYIYDEERQAYLVPVTGAVGLYTPEVENISTQNGQVHVTVGYIPTLASTTSLTLTPPTEPTKYMDYIFSRSENRQWYLTALQESEMQPEATATPSPGNAAAPTPAPQDVLESSLSSSAAGQATPVPETGEPSTESGDTAAMPPDSGSDTSGGAEQQPDNGEPIE